MLSALAGPVSLVGIRRDPAAHVSVDPSTTAGAYWLSIVRGAMDEVEASPRPLTPAAIDLLLEAMNLRADDLQWSRQRSESTPSNPFLGPEYKRATPVAVYFVRGKCGGPIKIGSASEMSGRLETLQAGNPDTLIVLGTMPGTISDEKRLHRQFAKYRVRGEWFAPAPELMEFIRLHTTKESGNVN